MTLFSMVAVLGAVIFAWAGSLSAGVVGRVLMGVGMACKLMGTFKLITLWFLPVIFATLTSITISIGTLGNTAASTPLVLLVQRVGWRMAFSIIATVNLLQIVLLLLVVRNKPGAGLTYSPKAIDNRFH
jgi:MFS family permease